MRQGIDPRAQRSRDAIGAAAQALLLEHGPTAVTHQRVAERAAVGRATVYRHWPRIDQLLSEAMAAVPLPFFNDPVSPYREWLLQEALAIADQLAHQSVLAVATTLASTALWDPAMDARRAAFAHALRHRIATGVEQARQHGELHTTIKSNDAAALVLGPIVYRATIEHAPTDASAVEHTITALGDWTR